jgi:hypothetical protein
MAEETIKSVTVDELLTLIGNAGEEGISYPNISLQLTGKSNLPRAVADKSFKPALMTLKKMGAIVKNGSNWTVVVPVQLDGSKKIDTPKRVEELPASIHGLLLAPKGRGTLARLLVSALHQITVETRPIKFKNAFAWVGPTEDLSSRQWVPLGELSGSRILIGESAPDFKAIPYNACYIKIFVADKAGSDEGTYYIGKLPEDWLAWVGQIE